MMKYLFCLALFPVRPRPCGPRTWVLRPPPRAKRCRPSWSSMPRARHKDKDVDYAADRKDKADTLRLHPGRQGLAGR